ncbi:helix-turn-helix domain-containing protein [Serratia fonticola]|uniref:helix-turn-helix domain-containing protein n=1 Tax=Serratia fonticola TaxID=47917 RepID=UPI00192CF1F6|nr:LuxR C-terminal-related transcriptional regulator [Serratia fonticola]MBL5829833.1 response regulator transcription factor [Serratia fonticola]
MISKKVILQSPCIFTQRGLEVIINETSLSKFFEIVGSTKKISQCETLLNHLPTVDVVILALGNGEYSLASLLRLVGDYLPHRHPSCKVVLMGEIARMNMLKRYFNGLINTVITLDSSTSLEELQKKLQNIVFPYPDEREKSALASGALSSRELFVLLKMLDGETPNQIANRLQLNYKTVSHYKRTALVKLGIRSLCPLVVFNHNKLVLHRGQLHRSQNEILTIW